MKNVFKLLVLAIFCVSVAACKKEQVRDEPVTQEPRVEEPKPITEPVLDPTDHTDARNIDNPESLLSQRVILFDFDQSTIRSEYRNVLRAHGEFLGANRNFEATLEGHADERGTREYNLALGERRADSVSDVLNAQGASGNQVEMVSYGEERPVCTASNESCWQRNRRVEIVYTSN